MWDLGWGKKREKGVDFLLFWDFKVCINKLMNHLVVAQLSQAVSYFNSLALDKLDPKLF